MMDNDLTNAIFLGTVSAGFPSPGDDWREQSLNLHDLVVKHSFSTYFMKIAGDSMTGACLHAGDIIVVDRALTATHKNIVVARLGDRFTVKRLWMMHQSRLMAIVDTLNRIFGRDTLFFAAQGIARDWRMRQTMLSPRFTTHWDEIAPVT